MARVTLWQTGVVVCLGLTTGSSCKDTGGGHQLRSPLLAPRNAVFVMCAQVAVPTHT